MVSRGGAKQLKSLAYDNCHKFSAFPLCIWENDCLHKHFQQYEKLM